FHRLCRLPRDALPLCRFFGPEKTAVLNEERSSLPLRCPIKRSNMYSADEKDLCAYRIRRLRAVEFLQQRWSNSVLQFLRTPLQCGRFYTSTRIIPLSILAGMPVQWRNLSDRYQAVFPLPVSQAVRQDTVLLSDL